MREKVSPCSFSKVGSTLGVNVENGRDFLAAPATLEAAMMIVATF